MYINARHPHTHIAAATPTSILHLFLLYLLPFFLPTPQPPPEEPGSQAKVSHLIRSLQWCQPLHTGKNNQSRPRGRFPCESEHLLGTRPTGHPAHTHAQTEVLGTRVGGKSERSYTSLKHSRLRYSPSPFWFPADCRCILGTRSNSRAEWQLSRAVRGGDCTASAEEHRALRLRAALNKEGLFNVVVRLSPSAAGANTIVNATVLAVWCRTADCPIKESVVSSLHCAYSSEK